jgi:hypothetical protein
MMLKKVLLLGCSASLVLGFNTAQIATAKDNPIQAIFKILFGGPKPPGRGQSRPDRQQLHALFRRWPAD